MPKASLLPLLAALACGVIACSRSGAPAAATAPTAPQAPNIVQPGAPGAPIQVLAAVPKFTAPAPTMADVMFMQGMIEHHEQALQMCALLKTHTQNPVMQPLGQKITIAQSQEIGLMGTWLRENHTAVPVIAADGVVSLQGKVMAPMPGMLSATQMRTLTAAHGAAFDQLFLTDMIQHHQGALGMVRKLRQAPGAVQGAGLNLLATMIDTDQTMEIQRMRGLLGETQ